MTNIPSPEFRGSQHSARSLALDVLLRAGRSRVFAQELLDERLTRAGLSPADRRLSTQLVYGVLRRRSALDALARPFVRREAHRVEGWLWETLRLGALQIAFLENIPPHAALHETVALASAFGRPGAKGFINAVLRRVTELVTGDQADGPSADALPVRNGRYRRLAKPVLPESAAHPVEYLERAFSLPGWLAARWHGRLGWEECVRLGFWFAEPAPLWLRCNPLRSDRPAVLGALAAAGIAAEPGEHPQAVRIAQPVAVAELPGFAEGWFTVQDESPMRLGSALSPRAGTHVLDLCAAPGGKTTHLAEQMGNRGRVVACDVSARRLGTLTSLCRRLGLTIVEPCRLHADASAGPPAGPFDAALVDVPCSNTGVLGRRVEARWRLQEGDLRRLVPLQTRLLLQAAERLRPGGVVVYSTCSIEPEENQGIVRTVLQGMPELELEAEEDQSPGEPSDGGYWARLRKRST